VKTKCWIDPLIELHGNPDGSADAYHSRYSSATPVIVLLPVLRSLVIVAARIIPELLHVNFNFPGIDSV
jgi:hypothetical protein